MYFFNQQPQMINLIDNDQMNQQNQTIHVQPPKIKRSKFQIRSKCCQNNLVSFLCTTQTCPSLERFLCNDQYCKCQIQHEFCNKGSINTILKVIQGKICSTQTIKQSIETTFGNVLQKVQQMKQDLLKLVESQKMKYLTLHELEQTILKILVNKNLQNNHLQKLDISQSPKTFTSKQSYQLWNLIRGNKNQTANTANDPFKEIKKQLIKYEEKQTSLLKGIKQYIELQVQRQKEQKKYQPWIQEKQYSQRSQKYKKFAQKPRQYLIQEDNQVKTPRIQILTKTNTIKTSQSQIIQKLKNQIVQLQRFICWILFYLCYFLKQIQTQKLQEKTKQKIKRLQNNIRQKCEDKQKQFELTLPSVFRLRVAELCTSYKSLLSVYLYQPVLQNKQKLTYQLSYQIFSTLSQINQLPLLKKFPWYSLQKFTRNNQRLKCEWNIIHQNHEYISELKSIQLPNAVIKQIRKQDLQKFKNLKYVNFKSNPLSKESIESLSKYEIAHPQVRVQFRKQNGKKSQTSRSRKDNQSMGEIKFEDI